MIVPSAFVRDRAAASLGLDPAQIRVIHHGIDHERFRPGGEPREDFLLYPARPWAHKNHARLYEAFALLRHDAARAAARAHRRRPLRRACPTASRCAATSRSTSSSRSTGRAAALVFPSLLRGLRAAAARGDGLRLPGRVLARGVAARGVRRRGAAVRPGRPGRDRGGGRHVLDDPAPWVERRPRAGGRASPWERSAAQHEDVYRELLGRLEAMCGICGLLGTRRARPGARRGDERRDRPSRPRPRRRRRLRPLRARLPAARDRRPRHRRPAGRERDAATSSRSSTASSTTSASCARELEAKGHEIRGTGDSPLIPHAYEEWGLDFVRRLEGMFAIALWDRARERLVLARDRLGKKPLALRAPPRRLARVRLRDEGAAAAAGRCRASSTSTQLDAFLALQYVPRSGLRAVEKVPPGSLAVAEGGAVRVSATGGRSRPTGGEPVRTGSSACARR